LAALLVLNVALVEFGPASKLDGGGGSKDGESEGNGSKIEAHVELVEKAVVRRAISLKNICRMGPPFILASHIFGKCLSWSCLPQILTERCRDNHMRCHLS